MIMEILQPSKITTGNQGHFVCCMSHLSLNIIHVMSFFFFFSPPLGAKQTQTNSIHISLFICAICLHCDLSNIEMLSLFLLNQSSKHKILGCRDIGYFSGILQRALSASQLVHWLSIYQPFFSTVNHKKVNKIH